MSETYMSQDHINSIIKAYDVRGVYGQDLTEQAMYLIGAAFATLLKRDAVFACAVGHDMRVSSPQLAAFFCAGLQALGCRADLYGLLSTDALYSISGHRHIGGAMITASHNPSQYNGCKMCFADAKPLAPEDLHKIREYLRSTPVRESSAIECQSKSLEASPQKALALAEYRDKVIHISGITNSESHRQLRIVVDAGNGMAGKFFPIIADTISWLEVIPLYFELDGKFPHHPANPLDPQNMLDVQEKVREEHADAGIAFDGDADRCFFVDEKGDLIAASTITALIAAHQLDIYPGENIIYNAICSQSVPETITRCGGKGIRSRVGHSFMKKAMAQHHAIFGGEHSAHYYFRDFFSADSGMIAAAIVMDTLSSSHLPLSALTEAYNPYCASGEHNVPASDVTATIQAIEDHFQDEIVTIDTLDGRTMYLKDSSWINVRPSNTEPFVRINIEGTTQERVDKLLSQTLESATKKQ